MSSVTPVATSRYASASPLLADAVNQSLVHFSKVHKVMIEFTSRMSAIYNETGTSMLSSIDVFSKKLADVNRSKVQGQNESYVTFVKRLMEQFEIQAKVMQTLANSFTDCVVTPLQDVVDKKKEIWRTCFHYIESFQQQVVKKEDDLVKRYKDYSDCCSKLKSSDNKKYQLMCHNSHNTYLLRLSSVNSINNLLYTHVIPHVLYCIEENQSELNDSLRHHTKYMFSVQKDSLKKILKSVDKIDHAATKIDLLSDLKKYSKSLKGKDKSPPYLNFTASVQDLGKRSSISLENMKEEFIVNKFTQPNLQRRLASLQCQTGELVNTLSSMESNENLEDEFTNKTGDPALNELIKLLSICDKEANLNVLLKQMELYTSQVIDFLGPMPENILKERLHTNTFPNHDNGPPVYGEGQKPHEFVDPKIIKPIFCVYCGKLIILTGRGFVCKICKISVHKKCAFNVPFCEGVSNRSQKVLSKSVTEEKVCENSVVYDLIDLDEDFYEDDEFNDGLSDSEGDLLSFSQPVMNPLKPASKPSYSPSPSLSQSSNIQIPPTFSKPSLLKPNQEQLPDTPHLSIVKPPISKKPSLNKKTSVSNLKEFCVTLYDFQATRSSDMSFTAGHQIEITDRQNMDWWYGKLDKFSGYFPSKYVMLIKENDRVLRAIYTFKAEGDFELTVQEGDIVVLLQEKGEWLKVKSSDGEGLVPSSYLEYLF